MPALDGIAFIDPRKSQVDIVQAVGRAIRKSENKTHGIIVIPVFIGDSDNPEAELENSRYKPIWDVLNALRSHDDVLAEELDSFRTSLGGNKGGSSGGFSKFGIDLPRTVGDQFVTAFKTRIVEVTTVSWHFWYRLLLNYVEEFGHARVPDRLEYQNFNLGAWVSNQKTNNNKGKLSPERIQFLESLPQWSWSLLEDQWNEGFEYLKKYVAEQGHTKIPRIFKYNDYLLGSWVSRQRNVRNKLSPEKIKQLESLPQWSWNLFEYNWNEGFNCLKKYVNEYENSRVPLRFKYNGFSLGQWVSHQRTGKDRLIYEKIKQLESLPQWSWNLLEDQWNKGFECLKKHVNEQGHARVHSELKYGDYSLGQWVVVQRKGKNKLSSEKIELLESLPQWSWEVFEDQWNEAFNTLKKYIEEHGHIKVPRSLEYEGCYLGSWIKAQRIKKNNLSPEKKALLELLPQWSWNPFEDQWNEGFEYLKKYVAVLGHTQVPQNSKYENFKLGAWVSTQRYARDKLDLKRIQLLESLPQWSWAAKSE